MNNRIRGQLLATGLIASAACASQGGVIFTDPASLDALLAQKHVESFESMSGAVGLVSFGGAAPATVSTSGSLENQIYDTTDGYGAVAQQGDMFWKLRGGSTVLDFGLASFDAFGFYYSDLEGATLALTFTGPDGAESVTLDDNNPNTNNFFGFVPDERFSSVTIDWQNTNWDGVGFDEMYVGTLAPAPGGVALLLAAAGVAATRRRR